jgi:hypothetical protein
VRAGSVCPEHGAHEAATIHDGGRHVEVLGGACLDSGLGQLLGNRQGDIPLLKDLSTGSSREQGESRENGNANFRHEASPMGIVTIPVVRRR